MKRFVELQDVFGYKYLIGFSGLLKGKIPEFVRSNNPYSLENISLWLVKNGNKFKLTKHNKYVLAKKNLEFECMSCGEIFYKGWDSLKNGRGCPFCSGTIAGDKNRLSIICPKLMLDWDYSKNKNIDPNDVSYGSNIVVWWKCRTCSYEWKTPGSWRGAGKNGCPACSNQVVTNKNRFSILFPNIAKEWDYEQNDDDLPSNVAKGSNKKFWWKCSFCEHVWFASVSSRTNVNLKSGCPACAGKIVTNKNRLSVLYPEISKEWDFSKNKDLTPDMVSYGVDKNVWWICSICGKEWEMKICVRTGKRGGCPKCNKSIGERRISLFLEEHNIGYLPQHRFPDCKNIFTLPFDFYIPRLHLCIEYNGKQHYHEVNNGFFGKDKKESFIKRKKLDEIKINYCKENNIPLLIIPYWEFDRIEEILIEELF